MAEADRSASSRDQGAPPVTILGMAMFVVRHWRLLLVLPVVVAALALLLIVVRQADYVAESTILPLAESSPASGLANVASRFGIPIGGASAPGTSVDFYARLVKSRDLLRAAVHSSYAPEAGGTGATLIDLLDVGGETDEERERAAIRNLDSRIGVEVDLRAGTVTIRTRAPERWLAERMNVRLLDLVNTFNIERRQSQAKAEREFAQRAAVEARDSLTAAEQAMEAFLAENRTYESSPRLRFEAARLNRRIDLFQGLYASLAQARDQVRLTEVRDTPVITVVSSPEGTSRSTRRPLLTLVVACFFGFMLALLVAIVRDITRRELRELPELAAEVRSYVPRWGVSRVRRDSNT